jgi:serine/threonine-protein kinase
MSVFENLRKRRVFQWLGAYIAGGFLALEGVDQLVGNEILPGVAYRIALVFYLFGFPGTLILAWFHGEKGAQKPPKVEIWLQSLMLVAALTISGVLIKNYRAAAVSVDEAAAAGLDPRAVAVLYFEDLSPDGMLSFAADGLTEALIERLSLVRALDVVSINGVATYRDMDLPPDSVARALQVGSLIQGSIEPRRDRLRVTARLVDGLSGADIERESFDLPAEDLLGARDSVAQSISGFLRERLGEEVRLRERKAGTASVEAWSFVQRAERLRKQSTDLRDHDELDDALDVLDDADSLLVLAATVDPTWTQPFVLRADVAFRRGWIWAALKGDFETGAAELQAGLPHAENALALSARDPDALEARGALRYILWLLDAVDDADEADRLLDDAQADFEAAVDADPSLASAWSTLSHLYMQRADNASVALAARRAYEEDAFLQNADQVLSRLFWAHYDLEQFNDASDWCEAGTRRFAEDHNFIQCQLWLMLAPSERADPDLAWELHASLQSALDEGLRALEERKAYLLVAGILRKAGLADSASRVLPLGRADGEIDPNEELVVLEARVLAITDDPDGAMELLKRYVAANPAHSFEVGGQLHWNWRSLRDRPDFRVLMSRE